MSGNRNSRITLALIAPQLFLLHNLALWDIFYYHSYHALFWAKLKRAICTSELIWDSLGISKKVLYDNLLVGCYISVFSLWPKMSEAREKSHYSVIFYFYTVNGVLFKSASSEPKSAEEKSGWTPDSKPASRKSHPCPAWQLAFSHSKKDLFCLLSWWIQFTVSLVFACAVFVGLLQPEGDPAAS